MAEKRKRIFSKELTLLTMSIYICAMLILGVTFSIISVRLFAIKAREDMVFYLDNIGEQFESKALFMEDIIITIRHNVMLEDFFAGNEYSAQEIKRQLVYNGNLFSERNMVNEKYPFVERIYIFNQKGAYENNFYYPITVLDLNKLNVKYGELSREFLKENKEYDYRIGEDVLDLCLRLYDGNMNEIGTCIVGVNLDSLKYLFMDLEKNGECFWMVNGREFDGGALLGYPKELLRTDFSKGVTGDSSWIQNKKGHGFGLETYVAVKGNAVYSSLGPTIITFAVVFLALLLGIAVVVVFLTRHFSRPLKIIVEHIRNFGRSGLETRLEGFSTQEFDDISVVFNEMADRINDLITQNYEKKLLATQTQVRFLQSQINPHFMFNILSMIGMKAKLQGNDDVMDLLTAFSKLIQGKIFRKDEIKIPLREEMELVGFYLYLQSNRFRDKITYEINYEKEAVKDNMIPRLCIEPIVENAVSHGLEQKEGRGKIIIDLYEKADRLYIVVRDDGVGFDVLEMLEMDRKADENHVHIGLANTRELIHILYGDSYGVQIESEKNVGTKVMLELPIEKRRDLHVESDDS